MYNLSVEHRVLNKGSLSNNIACHIRKYQIYGKVVIVTKDPSKLLIDIKKEWQGLKQEMRAEIADISDSNRKSLLINQLMYMQNCTFTDKPPIEDPRENVVVTTIEGVLEWAPICQTMYITDAVESDELHRATAWMPPYGLLVTYGEV